MGIPENRPSFLDRAKPLLPEKEVQAKPEQPAFLNRSKPVDSKSFPFEGDNDLDREIERNQARGLSRMLETTFGLPGDIQSVLTHFTGHEFDTKLPTSSSLRKKAESFGQGYLTPKNDFEKESDEFIKDVSSMLLPGSNTYSMFRNIGIPLLGAGAKKGVEAMGFEDGDPAKLGLMLTLDVMQQRKGAGGGAKDLAVNLFKQFEKEVSNGGYINARGLSKELAALKQNLKAGGSRPSTGEALKKVEELEKTIGTSPIMDIRDAYPFRSSINEIIDSMKGFEIGGVPKKIKERAISNLQNVKGALIDAVEAHTKAQNPTAYKAWKDANEAYSVYENSNKIQRFIKQTAKNFLKDPYIKGFLGAASGGGAMISPVAAGLGAAGGLAGTAAGATALKGVSLLSRLRSPVIAKHYAGILQSALQADAPTMIRHMKAMREELKKEED